jgi:hypothetical protein
MSGTIRNRLRFGGKERCPMPETARRRDEVSNKKYCGTTIGELRKTERLRGP